MISADPALSIESSKAAKLRIGVLCFDVEPRTQAELEAMVVQTPGAHLVENVDSHIVPREVMRGLEAFQYRICIVDFDRSVDEGCRIAQRLHDNGDNTLNVFAAATDASPDNILAAMRSGCSEFLRKPFNLGQVTEAIARVESRRHIKDQNITAGRVLTIIGAKGGTGVTALATHLALSLVERHNQKCLVIDQHPALGDVSLYLGLSRRQYSFYELVHNTDRLDTELLDGFLLRHDSGLHVLDSPEVIDSFPHAAPDAIEHTLSFLAEQYQFIIVDCPPGMTDDTAAAIRQSDQLAIVITPELPAVRNGLRWIEYLIRMNYPEKRIDVVLNRHSKNNALRDEEIEAALRRPIGVKIPNGYEQIARAINAGVPLARKHGANLPSAFDAWADLLIGGEKATNQDQAPQPRKWRLFGSRAEG